MTNITAQLRYLRISPRKMRLVADIVRGKNVFEATKQLMFLVKQPALPLRKLLQSAMANAKNNFNIKDPAALYIKHIVVNAGPVLKRYRARAFGRAMDIRKKTSHVLITLSESSQSKNRRQK